MPLQLFRSRSERAVSPNRLRSCRVSSDCVTRPPTWAWTKIASIATCALACLRSPSARRESLLIALTSTHGRTSIRAATGISRLNLQGKSHGKPKDVRPHQTRWDLAYRQAVQRHPHSGERYDKRPHGSGSTVSEAYRGDSKGAGLRSSARADFSSGGDQVSAGEPTEEKHPR